MAEESERERRSDGTEGVILEAELTCSAAKCAVADIRVRILDRGQGWLVTLRDRIWRCPSCGQQATLKWVQMAQVSPLHSLATRDDERSLADVEHTAWKRDPNI